LVKSSFPERKKRDLLLRTPSLLFALGERDGGSRRASFEWEGALYFRWETSATCSTFKARKEPVKRGVLDLFER